MGLARFAGPGHWNDMDMLEVSLQPSGSIGRGLAHSPLAHWLL